MKASQVKVADLKTYAACAKAIRDIEMDPTNIVGGYAAWTSGKTTYLTTAATRKVEAIERKMDSFEDED